MEKKKYSIPKVHLFVLETRDVLTESEPLPLLPTAVKDPYTWDMEGLD